MTNNLKPYAELAGYVASRRHPFHRGWLVIYDNKNNQLDIDTDFRWITSCETHGTLTSSSNLILARAAMKTGEFCKECEQEQKP